MPAPAGESAESDLAKAKKGGSMPLTGHLRELRNRIVVCVLVLFGSFVVFVAFAEKLVKILTDMGTANGYQFVFIAPQELILQYFRVAFTASLCVCLPLILYQGWAFARPGMTKTEDRAVLLSLIFGLGCFAIGVVFAYKVTIPIMLFFLINVGSAYIAASISVESYISFVLSVFVIFGCVFEMPMVTSLLARFGILKPRIMKKARKYAIVLIFVVAAIITPPDIFSQVMVALPMILLYEISLLLVNAISKRVEAIKKKKEAEFDAEFDGEEDEDDE